MEKAQKGNGDITDWLLWFLDCFGRALSSTEEPISSVLKKARFWESHRDLKVNERQSKFINMQFDGFCGRLTPGSGPRAANAPPPQFSMTSVTFSAKEFS